MNDPESHSNTFKEVKEVSKNTIDLNKQHSCFMSRNKFNKQAKTDFDTEHFSIGSPLLEKSNEPIDRINLPNSVSSLALLSTENSSKQINNKKMNETYSVQMQFKPFWRPSTQKQLLRNTSMVHFSSKNLKPSVPKKCNNYLYLVILLNQKILIKISLCWERFEIVLINNWIYQFE